MQFFFRFVFLRGCFFLSVYVLPAQFSGSFPHERILGVSGFVSSFVFSAICVRFINMLCLKEFSVFARSGFGDFLFLNEDTLMIFFSNLRNCFRDASKLGLSPPSNYFCSSQS